ncbi:MAG: phosphatidate cytidylyltransferase [bacterium]|nr:phosphatidate cytidylyltransferase [bacterium]
MVYYRIIIAVSFIIPLIYLIHIKQTLPFFLLISGIITLGSLEFYNNLAFKRGLSPMTILGVAACLILSFSAYGGDILPEGGLPTRVSFALAGLIFLIFLAGLLSGKVAGAMGIIAITLLGMLYVSFPLTHLILLRRLPDGDKYLYLVFLVPWISDIFAYTVGSNWGRYRITPVISPNKTLEGCLGGGIAAVLITVLAKIFFLPAIPLWHALILGFVIAGLSQLGDLVESLFKRDAGVKDSSTWLIGHGGILDVFDSVILTAPALFYYLVISH